MAVAAAAAGQQNRAAAAGASQHHPMLSLVLLPAVTAVAAVALVIFPSSPNLGPAPKPLCQIQHLLYKALRMCGPPLSLQVGECPPPFRDNCS